MLDNVDSDAPAWVYRAGMSAVFKNERHITAAENTSPAHHLISAGPLKLRRHSLGLTPKRVLKLCRNETGE